MRKEMVFTDENIRLKDLSNMFNSLEMKKFLRDNVRCMTSIINPESFSQYYAINYISSFFDIYGFEILKDGLLKNSVENFAENNMFLYVKDNKSDEIIGYFHISTNSLKNVFLNVRDINNNDISDYYMIHKGQVEHIVSSIVNWDKYNFSQVYSEAEVLKLILKAVQYGIIEKGPEDKTIVAAVKGSNSTDFRVLSIEEAVKDTIGQYKVDLLKDAIENAEKCVEGKLLEYKGIYFDEWSVEAKSGNIWAQICEEHLEEYKGLLKDELDESGSGCCSIYGCDNSTEGCEAVYYVDFKQEFIHFIDEKTYIAQLTISDISSRNEDKKGNIPSLKEKIDLIDKNKEFGVVKPDIDNSLIKDKNTYDIGK